MPSTLIKSFSKKSNKSTDEVEKLWLKAKELAKKENRENDYSYVVSILKKMLGLNESFLTYSESINKRIK